MVIMKNYTVFIIVHSMQHGVK